jgi:hypothetical protein
MYLRAVSIGYAVPHVDFDVVVHSVFRSAVNLKPKAESRLITLLASSEANLPQGIRLYTPNGFSFEELSVGIQGVCRNGILNFEIFSLTIDLQNTKYWDGSLLALHANMNNPSVTTAWRSAWQLLNNRQLNSESELVAKDLLHSPPKKQSALSQQIHKALHDILKATREYSFADDHAIGTLIGLGIGLTPSGDDLLVGYIAGLYCAANGEEKRLSFISALSEVITRLSDRTNDISRTYLYHAAHGQVSSRLVDLANAICTGADPQYVRECAIFAMQAGHTSGMDVVTGLMFGLIAWDI